MVIKEGYKQTEIGVIPKDWEVKKLGSVSDITKLAGFEYSLHFNSYNDGGDIIVVRGTNITHNKMDLSDVKNIPTSTSNKLQRSKLFKNDLVFAYVGTIGPVYLIEEDNKYHLGPNTSKITVKKELFSKFVYHYFTSGLLKKEIVEHTSIGAQPSLSMSKIRSFRIIAPPTIAEQTAIATALSDIDGLITSLEKLIAKKRNIKQGVMQQLLQPKDGWEVKKLGEVSDLITKGTTPTSVGREFQNKGINFIKIESLQKNGEIVKDKVAFIDEFTHNLLKRSQLKSKDILFSIAGALGRVAIVKDEILPANTNQALAIIRLKDGYLVDYIYFYLNNEKIQKYILTISVQGAQANLSLLNISELDIPFPALEEQTRIASVLTDMDAELSAIEQKLEKYKKVKLGMMQELLTGKTRLI